MNDEKVNIDQINNDMQVTPEVPSIPPAAVPARTETPQDISKVKIRTILNQRIKKCGFKRIISFVLIAILAFAAGVCTDRAFFNHRKGKDFKDRPGINRQTPKNKFNKKQPNNNKQPSNSTQQNP